MSNTEDGKFRIIIKGKNPNVTIELKEFIEPKVGDYHSFYEIKEHFFCEESPAAFYYNSFILHLIKDNDRNRQGVSHLVKFQMDTVALFNAFIDVTRMLIWLYNNTIHVQEYLGDAIDFDLIDFSNFDETEVKKLLKRYLNDLTDNEPNEHIKEFLGLIETRSGDLYGGDRGELWHIYRKLFDSVKTNQEIFKTWNDFKGKDSNKRCVAYFESNYRKYVSFSGASVNYEGTIVSKWSNKYKEISTIVYNNIFTDDDIIFCNLKDDCLRYLELDHFTRLLQPTKLSDNYDPNNKGKLSRAFSCCERKIVSYLKENEKLLNGIIRYEPCGKCVPALAQFEGLEIQVPAIDIYEKCVPCVFGDFLFCCNEFYKNGIKRYRIENGELKKIQP